MRPRPTMLLAVLVPLLAIGCAKPEWQEFRDPGGVYKIEMPGKPRSENDLSFNGKLVRVGSTEFVIGATRMPRQRRSLPAETIFADARAGAKSAVEGTVAEEKSLTSGSWKGREWRIKTKGATAVTRCYLSPGNEWLVMAVVARNGWGSPKQKHVDRFFNSLEFLKHTGGGDADGEAPAAPSSPAPEPALANTFPQEEPAAPPSTLPGSESNDGLPDLNAPPQPDEVAANEPPGFEPPTFEPPVPENPDPFRPPEPEEGADGGFDFPQPAFPGDGEAGEDGFAAVPRPQIPREPTAEVGTAEYAVQSVVLKLYHDELTGLEEVISDRASGTLRKLRSGDLPPAELAALKQQLGLVKLLAARDVGRTGRFVTLRNSFGQTIEFTCRREGDVFRVTKATVR